MRSPGRELPRPFAPWAVALAGALVLSSMAAASAGAAGLRGQVEEGNELLRRGDASAALDLFTDLQARHPNSAEVQLGLGSAQYQEGLRAAGAGGAQEAAELFKEAEASFARARALGDGRIDAMAEYNRANAAAQAAKQLPALGDPQGGVEALRQAMARYEALLRTHPDHPQARHNLEHVRYELKRILQEPPQDQEQEQEQRESGESEESEDQQQQQPSQQPPPEEDQDEGSDDPSQQDAQEEGDPRESDAQQDPSQDPNPDASPQPQEGQEMEDQTNQRENIEALLQSLEDQDRREQQQLRKAPRDTRLRQEWW